jgi:pimeloyl-ACP methyl ester carboxylesterase
MCSDRSANSRESAPTIAPDTDGAAAVRRRAHPRASPPIYILLEKAGVQGVLVLVGHSLGGLYARHYAATYPAEIAGMVLVDSTHEDQDKPPAPLRLVLKVVSHSGLPRLLLRFGDPALDAMYASNRTLAAINDEFAAVEESSSETRAAHVSLGSKPLIVLTSGSNDADPTWQRLQKDLVTRSSNSKRIVASGSGHYIQDDRPDLVIAAVREVVAATKSTKITKTSCPSCSSWLKPSRPSWLRSVPCHSDWLPLRSPSLPRSWQLA